MMKRNFLSMTMALAALPAWTYTATFISNWKNPVSVETPGRLVLEHPGNFNGKMFVGWKDPAKKLHQKWEVVSIDRDTRYVAEYAPLDLSRWTAGSDGKAKRHTTGQGIFYALGDSITFGTKAGGNKGAWANLVAEKLGLKCVNDAQPGSRLSAWRSVLTKALNHNQYIEEHVKGVTRDQMLDGIRRAGVIGFTLGTNDAFFNNAGADIAYRMFEFVEALHHENPQALIVVVGGADSLAFREGGQYAKNGAAMRELNDALAKGLNGPKFSDYALYVEITDLFAQPDTYEPCERKPDGIHPGFEGQKKIAAKVLSLVTACPNASAAPKFKLPEETPSIPKPPMVTLPTTEEMWTLKDAAHETTRTRERYSLNGLWAFKPVGAAEFKSAPPVASMDYFFKVPGLWPKADKHAKNGMAVYSKNGSDAFGVGIRGEIESAWYGRTIDIPANWRGREIVLQFAWMPTAALVYVDGAKVGEVFFPGGEVSLGELTSGRHELAFFTSAKLAETMITAFDAPDTARSFAKKRANFAGVNGDVWIAAEPKGFKLDNVQVRPDVPGGKIAFRVEATQEKKGGRWIAEVFEDGKLIKSFTGEKPLFGGAWKDAKVWDLDTPDNLYTVKVRYEENGKVLDELYPETFGFRSVAIEGRDILLNGTPIHFRPCNTEYSRQTAVANEDIRRAAASRKEFGFNAYVPTANYGFSEGDVTTFEAMVRESSAVGMVTVVGLPHPNRFDDPKNPHHWQYGPAYDRLVKYMVKRLQNIPGLLYWSSTHNQTGYESDQNPAIISGKSEEVPTGIINWRQRFRKLALVVNEKMKSFDPTRPVYHHESGALAGFYTLNCYLDWAPIQERSDWFEHWEKEGVVPLIIVEWGSPHIASWSTFRGGPKMKNIWSARDWTQHCWMNEFNSSFLGERAFADSPWKRMMMDRTEYKSKGNKPSYYGGNFTEPLINELDTSEVLSLYARRNYRDLRARGVTSFLPWDIDGGTFFTNNPARPRSRQVRDDLLKNIKAFGVVRSDYSYGLFDQADELPRAIGKTLNAAYADLLGWIAGPIGDFTSVNDSFRVGETVKKSLVILNDSRRPRQIEWSWKVRGENEHKGGASGRVTIPAGKRVDIPIEFIAAEGMSEIVSNFKCAETGWKLKDSFSLNLSTLKPFNSSMAQISLFDPEGTAKPLLRALGLSVREVTSAPKSGILVIGRNAFKKAPFEVFAAAKAGVRVVVLEQDEATLRSLGFRTQEHALRNLFALEPSMKALDLTDWRGRGTMIPEYLKEDPMSGQFAERDWMGFKNRRVWRAGNRGVVATILPEKPTRGDFLPLIHGGFDLQYAPVMEYREGQSRVIFSQLDLCGRTERSPEAEDAFAAIIAYAARPLEAQPKASVMVVGVEKSDEELRKLAEGGARILQLGPFGKGKSYPDVIPELETEELFRGISNADLQWVYPSVVGSLAKTAGKALAVERIGKGIIVRSAVSPKCFDENEIALRVNRRRAQGLVTRLKANLGGKVETGFLDGKLELYADRPVQDDDPYRYYRW